MEERNGRRRKGHEGKRTKKLSEGEEREEEVSVNTSELCNGFSQTKNKYFNWINFILD